MTKENDEYQYASTAETWDQSYLWPKVKDLVLTHVPPPARVMELGCGNGVNAKLLKGLGYSVVAIDSSESGIEMARRNSADIEFDHVSVYEPLAHRFGKFPLVVSIEVIEHLLYPARFVSVLWDLLEDGGVGVITTPYHGYWKNLALAVSGRMDAHFGALWEGGHIKFFSVPTMTELLRGKGFKETRIEMAGRLPFIWKSMIAIFRKPVSS